MTEPTLTLDEILAAFTPMDQPYQRAAVEAALQQRDAIIPRLIEVLERTLADPASQDESVTHIYAAMLLGHFRAVEAHAVIASLLRLPKAEDWAYRLFGDLITEEMPMVLFRTCGGSVAQIQALIEDRQADDFCRGTGARALNYAVVEGITPRAAALEFFGSLFTGDEANPDSVFWSLVMETLSHLYPAGWVETLRSAFDRNLIDESVIEMKDIEEIIETGSVAEGLREVRVEMARTDLDDIHGSMAGWAMFDTLEDYLSVLPPANAPLQRKQATVAQAKKKQKRKAAKATRKKNRRKK